MNPKTFALKIAKQAGKNIRDNFALGMAKQYKSDYSPVTVTDLKNNKLVIDQVAKHFPGHSVLGEEASNIIKGSRQTWVCDPVDGTVPFSHGIPTCVFSLALVDDGRPILGVIYDPFMDRMFFAEKGKGAFLNGGKIKVNKSNMDRAVVGWSNKGTTEMRKQFPNVPVVTLWSICYEGILVASGELNACFYDHINAHDIAALKIIVEEAGGKVTDKFGREQRYDGRINGALVSNGVAHNELLKFIKNTVVK